MLYAIVADDSELDRIRGEEAESCYYIAAEVDGTPEEKKA